MSATTGKIRVLKLYILYLIDPKEFFVIVILYHGRGCEEKLYLYFNA